MYVPCSIHCTYKIMCIFIAQMRKKQNIKKKPVKRGKKIKKHNNNKTIDIH